MKNNKLLLIPTLFILTGCVSASGTSGFVMPSNYNYSYTVVINPSAQSSYEDITSINFDGLDAFISDLSVVPLDSANMGEIYNVSNETRLRAVDIVDNGVHIKKNLINEMRWSGDVTFTVEGASMSLQNTYTNYIYDEYLNPHDMTISGTVTGTNTSSVNGMEISYKCYGEFEARKVDDEWVIEKDYMDMEVMGYTTRSDNYIFHLANDLDYFIEQEIADIYAWDIDYDESYPSDSKYYFSGNPSAGDFSYGLRSVDTSVRYEDELDGEEYMGYKVTQTSDITTAYRYTYKNFLLQSMVLDATDSMTLENGATSTIRTRIAVVASYE